MVPHIEDGEGAKASWFTVGTPSQEDVPERLDTVRVPHAGDVLFLQRV